MAVYAISTPWLHQDTTTIVFYGAYEDAPKTEPPPIESRYRVVVEVEALAHPEEDNGWTVLLLESSL